MDQHPRHVEDDILLYFYHEIEETTARLYCDILEEYHYFGHASIIPPFSTDQNFKPGIVYMFWNEALTHRNPDIWFAIGDYKTENYFLTKLLQELKLAMTDVCRKAFELETEV